LVGVTGSSSFVLIMGVRSDPTPMARLARVSASS